MLGEAWSWPELEKSRGGSGELSGKLASDSEGLELDWLGETTKSTLLETKDTVAGLGSFCRRVGARRRRLGFRERRGFFVGTTSRGWGGESVARRELGASRGD